MLFVRVREVKWRHLEVLIDDEGKVVVGRVDGGCRGDEHQRLEGLDAVSTRHGLEESCQHKETPQVS